MPAFIKNQRHCLLILLVMALFAFYPELVWAADGQSTVFSIIKTRALTFLKNSKGLIYVIAGFGLIGFAFMAIFNKISWKWFANIAIGLLLVALMGHFIDYFTTRSGAKGNYARDLDYGYDMGSKTENPGTEETIPTAEECKDHPELPGCEPLTCDPPFIMVGNKCVNPEY